MRGINTVFLVGTVGRDPEPRTTASGKVVCSLSIATEHGVRSGEEWSQKTDWHRVDLWERDADRAVRFLRKGSPVAIIGSLRTDSWTDNNGIKRYRTFIFCQNLQLLPDGRRHERPRPSDDTGGPPILDTEPIEADGGGEGEPPEIEEIPF